MAPLWTNSWSPSPFIQSCSAPLYVVQVAPPSLDRPTSTNCWVWVRPEWRPCEGMKKPTPTALESVRDAAERALREGHHYDYCRKLGQLGPLRLISVTQGVRRYEAALTERGMRAGNVKPPGLHRGLFWGDVFSDGLLVETPAPAPALSEGEQ